VLERNDEERRAINENEEQRNDGSATRETKIATVNGRGSCDAVRLERKPRRSWTREETAMVELERKLRDVVGLATINGGDAVVCNRE